MVKQLNEIAMVGALFVAVTGSALAQTARDQPQDGEESSPTPPSPALPFDRLDSARPPSKPSRSVAAEAGLASPYTLSAKVGQSWARAVGGYDSATQSFRMSSSAEAAVTRYLSLRADFDHGPSTSATDRVSLGMKLQLLSQNAHGLDLGVGLFYQPNDFRREGNVVAALMLDREFDRLILLGSVLLGSDPEGDDQEVDGRLGTLVRVSRLVEVGLDSRFRTAFSSDNKRVGTSSIDWEVALLPSANLRVGPVLLIGEAGVSTLKKTDRIGEPDQHRTFHTGIIVMSGLGLRF